MGTAKSPKGDDPLWDEDNNAMAAWTGAVAQATRRPVNGGKRPRTVEHTRMVVGRQPETVSEGMISSEDLRTKHGSTGGVVTDQMGQDKGHKVYGSVVLRDALGMNSMQQRTSTDDAADWTLEPINFPVKLDQSRHLKSALVNLTAVTEAANTSQIRL